MKIALFVTLCVVAAAASYNPRIHSSVFRPGEEYVYHYKGQLISGIPKSSNQFAGLLLDSLVVFQFQQNNKVVMKMEKIKLFKVNDKITQLPSEPLPESELTRLTGEQASVITESLVKPVKFRYEQGEVRDLEKEITDPYWSMNIKRGILSLLQVTLKEKSTYSTQSFYQDPIMSRTRYGSPRSFSPNTPYWKLVTKSNSAYKVMEKDVMGNCESEYVLISDKTHLSTSTSHMKVSRVKNFNNCLSKPFMIEGLFQGVHTSLSEKDLIEPTVHTDYVISGDRNQFLIKDVKLRGKYFFLVNGLEGGDISTYIYQQLTLKNVEPMSQPIRLSSSKISPKGLEMVIPKSSLVSEQNSFEERSSRGLFARRYPSNQEFLRSPYQELEEEVEEREYSSEESSQTESVVEEKLNELVECLYTPTTEKQCSKILYELSRVIRELKKPQLKSIILRHIQGQHPSGSETEYRKSEILLDILPTLPSPDAGKVLLELIKERHITKVRAPVVVKIMAMTVKPTPSLITKVLELSKELPEEPSNKLTLNKMLRNTLLLSTGTLTNRLVNIMRSEKKPVPQVINFVETISSELHRIVEESSSEEMKIAALKAIGNMGASESITPLKNIIEDERQPPVIRIHAISACRRLVKPFDKQVTPLLLSTFMDIKEITEVRQTAFLVLLKSDLSYTTLQMIAHRVRHEPSTQIRTLVYSSLLNLALHTSHQPEHKQLIKNARLVMKTLPPVHVGIHDSISVVLNKFSEEYDLGGSIKVEKIKSKMSMLPEAIFTSVDGTLFGKHRRLVDVGVVGKSLETILRKFFGPHGLLKNILRGEFSTEDILRPLSRPEMGRIGEKIRETLQQIITENTPELEQFGVSSQLYIRVLENEIGYISLNSENIRDVIEKVTTVLPEILLKLNRGVHVDIVKTLSHIASVNIATPLGIPLSLNATTMGIVKVQGHMKLNNLPTWSEMVNRFSSFERIRNFEVPNLKLEVDLKPHVDAFTSIQMGPDMRWLGSGVGAMVSVKSKVPVKVEAELKPTQHSVNLKYFTPKQEEKVLSVVATPYTYVKFIPVTVSRLPYMTDFKEMRSEELVKETPFQFRYPCSITGLEIETEGLYSVCGPTWCPIMPLFGKQIINIKTRPTSSVDYVELKIKSVRTNLEFEGIPLTMEPEEIFTKHPEELEEEQRLYNIHGSYRRPVVRSMIESGEFEPIRQSPIFSSQPIKRQVLVTLGPNNRQSPQVKALLTWLMSRRYWKNQVNVQVMHLAHQETPAWKIEVDNVINPQVWYPEESQMSEPVNELKVKWNVYGNANEVKIKVLPGSPFDFTRELNEHSILPTLERLPETNTKKYKYTVEVEVPQMTHKLMKYITICHDLIKLQFFSKLTTSIPVQPTNKLIISVEVLPWWEKMNVIVKSPRENSYIKDIPLRWNPFQPTSEKIRLHDVPAWKWYKSLEDSEYFQDTVPYKSTPFESGKCMLGLDETTTFDNAKIRYASFHKVGLQGCSMVFAQHCHHEGLFSVVGYDEGNQWIIKMLVPEHEVRLNVELNSQTMHVKVDEEEKYVSEGSPIVVGRPESSKQLILKKTLGKLEVTEPELGVKITFDPTTMKTTIKMSQQSMLQGQLCGVCGNFNQDPSDDYYTTSDFQLKNRDLSSFIRRNLLETSTCRREDVDRAYTSYYRKPKEIKVTRYENGIKMICKSENPVEQCTTGSVPETTTSIKTCFTCLSEEGTTLPRQTFVSARWDTYENENPRCTDFFQRVEVPTRCIPVY